MTGVPYTRSGALLCTLLMLSLSCSSSTTTTTT
eukprot:CAMPEP_0182581924 /NCGR_PEP_ID=MMETSP1324-20130603/51296_1 /TAXON_ID=236786 /ORGANISM="Florenciella sp., Strain RCC1587" /LENGTH=32 /DNA_ID= /DNA_START= /DNA_END= /DNA_ORIENTATION=